MSLKSEARRPSRSFEHRCASGRAEWETSLLSVKRLSQIPLGRSARNPVVFDRPRLSRDTQVLDPLFRFGRGRVAADRAWITVFRGSDTDVCGAGSVCLGVDASPWIEWSPGSCSMMPFRDGFINLRSWIGAHFVIVDTVSTVPDALTAPMIDSVWSRPAVSN